MKFIKKLFLFLVLIAFLPITIFAKTEYKDVFGPTIDYKSDKVTIYLFYLDGCSHCAAEKAFLKDLKKEYPDLNIVYFEVNEYDKQFYKAQEVFDFTTNGVPLTIIGEEYYSGFVTGGSVENNIKEQIKHYYDENEEKHFEKKYEETIPILGKTDLKSVSIPLVTIVLGLVDGFNPCAMWVLLFLLTILINTNNRKKMLLIGSIFLFVSGAIYYLSILGINSILSVKYVQGLRSILGLIAIGVGIYNIYSFFKNLKSTGCEIVDDKKRKNILQRVNKIIATRNIILVIIGVSLLAISVNAIEMACSLGFPTIFSEIMALNNIKGILRLLLILTYVIFYMLDDTIVFIIAMISLKLVGTSNRIGKIVKLLAAIIMITMGILLIFFPDIIMLNF